MRREGREGQQSHEGLSTGVVTRGTTVPFISRNIISQSYWPIRTSCLREASTGSFLIHVSDDVTLRPQVLALFLASSLNGPLLVAVHDSTVNFPIFPFAACNCCFCACDNTYDAAANLDQLGKIASARKRGIMDAKVSQ